MTQSPCLPELPKPAVPSEPIMKADSNRSAARGDYYQDGVTPPYFTADQMNAHYLKGYEAGSAAAAQAVPEGFVLVPREITPDMIRAWTAAPTFEGGYRAMLAAALTQGAEGAAPQAVVGEAKPVPLTEPVTVAKAMLAHRQAEVWLNEGTGPVCCVGMVNIQVTPWHRHNPSEAKAFADGFNLAAKWMRNAVASPTPTAPQEADALREALAELVDWITDDEGWPVDHPISRAVAALAQHQPQQGEQR